ncbi:hypothetical protein NL676_005019 [Syzygium grande]|nr:hypothetical protein NL676_005019 [Syzygium grande]
MAVNYRSESSGGGGRGETVVVDCGRRRSSCGYCRSRNGSSVSHDLRAQSLTVDDYQGWYNSSSDSLGTALACRCAYICLEQEKFRMFDPYGRNLSVLILSTVKTCMC